MKRVRNTMIFSRDEKRITRVRLFGFLIKEAELLVFVVIVDSTCQRTSKSGANFRFKER